MIRWYIYQKYDCLINDKIFKVTKNDKLCVKRTIPIHVQKTAHQNDEKSRATTPRISKEETAIPTKLPFGEQSKLTKTITSCEVQKENLHDASKKNAIFTDIHNQLEVGDKNK